MDIVVLASGNGSTFQAILERCKHVNIRALVTNNPDSYALERAKKFHIAYGVTEHKNIQRTTSYFRPQLIVLAGYMRILNEAFVRAFPHIVNIHPSLLPKYKGLNTYNRVLDSGDSKHGTTVHWVNEELDAGKIIAQEEILIGIDDTAELLQDKVQEIERDLYPRIIDQIAKGEIMAQTR